ncbi:hypothetical protein LZS99_09870, partial [Vibrio fluvialis]|uniref:hypothetical protein n=1 Tax=Vibrio fluvialis TaxID=676 RepID=UPI001F245960
SGYSLCQQRVTGASHRKPPISLKPKRDKPLNKFQTPTNHHQQIPFPQKQKKTIKRWPSPLNIHKKSTTHRNNATTV